MSEQKRKSAFTLIETAAVIAIASVLALAVGISLVDGQQQWQSISSRVFGGPTIEGLMASKAFEASVRKSVASRYDSDGSYARLYYYTNPALSVTVDGYVHFYVSQHRLKADYGNVVNGIAQEALYTTTLANDVESCTFARNGSAVEMNLKLNNGRTAMTVCCSAIQNNM